MQKNNEYIQAEVNGEIYYITKCYTFDLNYPLRKLTKEELKDNCEDKHIFTTYCVLIKDKLGRYRIADNCKKSNNTMEKAIDDFMKNIYGK